MLLDDVTLSLVVNDDEVAMDLVNVKWVLFGWVTTLRIRHLLIGKAG